MTTRAAIAKETLIAGGDTSARRRYAGPLVNYCFECLTVGGKKCQHGLKVCAEREAYGKFLAGRE